MAFSMGHRAFVAIGRIHSQKVGGLPALFFFSSLQIPLHCVFVVFRQRWLCLVRFSSLRIAPKDGLFECLKFARIKTLVLQ